MSKNKTLIIAELSANHGNDIEIAKKTILAAKNAGADAVKVQTYTADTMTLDCHNDNFQLNHGTIWDGEYLYDLYKRAYMPWEWQPKLKEYADSIGIECFSTPFDKTAVDFLEQLNPPYYKIASFEITDTPLIAYTATRGRPMILSTGIATEEEIQDAVDACRKVGNNNITLLKCTSQYPSKPEDANLATMDNMKEKFGVKVGLSDHTMGSDVAVVAATLGATIIEKHFILDREVGGPDASFSMTPDEFSEMVQKVRKAEAILGKVSYEITESKQKSRHFARSLYVVKDVKSGDTVSEENVRSIRPGNGLAPKYFKDIVGKAFKDNIERGTPLSLDLLTEYSIC